MALGLRVVLCRLLATVILSGSCLHYLTYLSHYQPFTLFLLCPLHFFRGVVCSLLLTTWYQVISIPLVKAQKARALSERCLESKPARRTMSLCLVCSFSFKLREPRKSVHAKQGRVESHERKRHFCYSILKTAWLLPYNCQIQRYPLAANGSELVYFREC